MKKITRKEALRISKEILKISEEEREEDYPMRYYRCDYCGTNRKGEPGIALKASVSAAFPRKGILLQDLRGEKDFCDIYCLQEWVNQHVDSSLYKECSNTTEEGA